MSTPLSDPDNVMFYVVENYVPPEDGFTDDEVARWLNGQPLVAAAVAESFHMPGKHDQEKHGHGDGNASPGTSKSPSAGKPLKVTHMLVHKKYEPGTVITKSGDGNKRVKWDGSKYLLQRKDGNDWTTEKTAIKSKAYVEVNRYDSDWRTPDGESDVKTAPSESEPKVTPASAPASISTQPPSDTQSGTYTSLQRSKVQAIFAKNNLKWHSDTKKLYDAAQEVSKTHSDLTMTDALDIMDQSLQKKTGNPFRTKVEKFLKTNAGKNHVLLKGGSAPTGKTTPSIAPTAAPTLIKPSQLPQPTQPAQPTSSTSSEVDSTAKVLTISSANALQEAMNKKTPPPWTQEQRESIRFYTNGPYRELNACARKVGPCTPELRKHIKNLNAVMKPSTESVVVYRSADPRAFGLDHKKFGFGRPEGLAMLKGMVGKTVTDNGIVSTSINNNLTWNGKFNLEIEAPEGTKMAWVQSVSGHKNEQEMMLPPGLRYEVVSAEQTGMGFYNIRLRIVKE